MYARRLKNLRTVLHAAWFEAQDMYVYVFLTKSRCQYITGYTMQVVSQLTFSDKANPALRPMPRVKQPSIGVRMLSTN